MPRKTRAQLQAQVAATIRVSPLADPSKTRGVDHRALERDEIDTALLHEDLLTSMLASDFRDFVLGGLTPDQNARLGWVEVVDATNGPCRVHVAESAISPFAWRTTDGVRGTYDINAFVFTPDATAAEEGVPYFFNTDPGLLNNGTGRARRHLIGGVRRFFENLVVFTTAPIPAPTGDPSDTNWTEVSPDAYTIVLPRYYPLLRAAFLALQADDIIQTGAGYLISRTYPLEPIYVEGVGPASYIADRAARLNGDGSITTGTYDVVADTFAEGVAGAATGWHSRIVGGTAAVGGGSKSFTVGAGLLWVAGHRWRLDHPTSGAFLAGTVTSYDRVTGAFVGAVDGFGGSGSIGAGGFLSPGLSIRLVAGTNVSIDYTNPYAPVVSATGSGIFATAGEAVTGTEAAKAIAPDVLKAEITRRNGLLPLTTERTSAYTIALADAGQLIPVNSASAITITIPLNSTTAFPVGTLLSVRQRGAGQVTVAGAGGVTVNAPGGGLKTPGQWYDLILHKTDTNSWLVKGGTV